MNGYDGTYCYNKQVKKLEKLDLHSFGDNIGVCMQLVSKDDIAK